MSHGLQVLDNAQIKLPPLPHSPPSVKLSFLDTLWILIPPVQRLLLYSKPVTDLAFPLLLQALKSSLTSTLRDFPPLAGQLSYVQATGDVEIDLSDPSVTFIEAGSDLDLHQLATSEIHDVESFMKLVPAIDVSMLPFPVLAVQVTRFGCGGLAIGYSFHHAVADGKAMLGFLEAWTRACRAKLGGMELLPSENHKPSYDRSRIKHPRGDELARAFIRSMMPNPPYTGIPSLTTIQERRLAFSRRTFLLDARSIRLLKQLASQGAFLPASQPPSTFTVITAYTWVCYARTRSLDPDLDTMFLFLMDCRARLDPPLEDDYFGNCVCLIFTTVPAGELISEDCSGFIRACKVIRESVVETLKDPLRGAENWLVRFGARPLGRTFNVIASPRFRVCDTNFGWGGPARSEVVSMNEDGEFALVAGKEEGSVQVSVVERPERMEAFAELFRNGIELLNA